MNRYILDELIKWKNKPNRKPLILEGARQVGKTWLMKELGSKYFDSYLYVNCDNNKELLNELEKGYDIDRILEYLEFKYDKKIVKEKTLVIFDEIQEIPKLLSSLKYFYEQMPELHIVCAGSYLGMSIHKGFSFPVGKVETIKIYPMTFLEFLDATNNEKFAKILLERNIDLINSSKNDLELLLKKYLFVGGMPEVVKIYSKTNDYEEVRNLQNNILDAYDNDFSKHLEPRMTVKVRDIWNNIIKNLDKENKKFVYGMIREGARAKSYEEAMMWLCDIGIVHKVKRVNAIKLPLKEYTDDKVFKLFLLDVGLLTCMAGLKKEVIVDNLSLLKEFKGAIAENFICNELLVDKNNIIRYYTNERSTLEIDFVVDNGKEVVPVEVKSEINFRAKSLMEVINKFNIKKAIRFSFVPYENHGIIVDKPLYMPDINII